MSGAGDVALLREDVPLIVIDIQKRNPYGTYCLQIFPIGSNISVGRERSLPLEKYAFLKNG